MISIVPENESSRVEVKVGERVQGCQVERVGREKVCKGCEQERIGRIVKRKSGAGAGKEHEEGNLMFGGFAGNVDRGTRKEEERGKSCIKGE